MEQLIETRGQDPVSELLQAVRVRSTVYCRSVMGAPWGFSVEAHGNPAFHLVTAGGCWLEVGGETEQVALVAGDLVVLPTGRRHVVRDDPATPAPDLDEILIETPPDKHRRLRHGGPGPRTELLCGGFAIEGPGVHPVLRALPPLVHIRGAAGRPRPWVAASIQVLAAVTSSNAPGAEPVIQRLADALLTQTLRIALAEPDARLSAHLSAWRDPEIAAAIELIHDEPGHPWTVGDLAARIGLSRSAFAARFRRTLGESPKRYITRCRLAHAAQLLHSTGLGIAEIAQLTGYESEFSLGKAFKRAFGVAPGAYRDRPDSQAPELQVVA